MTTYYDASPITITRCQKHEEHKDHLIGLIDEFKSTHQTLYKPHLHSDWHLPNSQVSERPYLSYFYSIIEPVMESIGDSLGFKFFDWHIHNGWFQQYTEGGNHPWHNHPGCHFTNAYYLELPDEKYKTEIMGLDGESIEYTAKEGDVMTCGAWMQHRSPIHGPGRKTVISFNSDFRLHLDYEGNRNLSGHVQTHGGETNIISDAGVSGHIQNYES